MGRSFFLTMCSHRQFALVVGSGAEVVVSPGEGAEIAGFECDSGDGRFI